MCEQTAGRPTTRRRRRLIFLLPALPFGWLLPPTGAADLDGPYQPTWESLQTHTTPVWFRDAKFGIYTHWGPIAYAAAESPRAMDWYATRMYEEDRPEFQYHKERFGDQETFGYKDIIPLFKAEGFDAGEWADLFRNAGAKFAGPVAIHHDNYAMWDSAETDWDSMDTGPKRDVTGELERAIRGRGMKFIATFHHGFSWRYFEPAYRYDAADPAHAGLYCEPHTPGDPPSRVFLESWLAKVNEVEGKYRPDLIWFDFGLGSVIADEYQRRMFADYYNRAAAWGTEVGVAHKHPDLHRWTGILDFERGRMDQITDFAWLTDTSVGAWFHHKDPQYRSVNELVDLLVDIVSKNGCMLLNVGPDGDGRIPEKAQQILLGIGDWLKVNGEAIYDTRPWRVFGEGPTRSEGGAFSESRDKPFTAQDIRYTTKGDVLYAICLDWPSEELVLQSIRVERARAGAKVELLGHAGGLGHRVDEDGQLTVRLPDLAPDDRPCQHAYAFRLAGFQFGLSEAAAFAGPDAVTLDAEKAVPFGRRIRLQEYAGRLNTGFWDLPDDSLHWLLPVERPGEYLVRGEFSAAYASARLALECADGRLEATVPKTKDWATTAFVPFGRLKFEEPGVYQVVLRPADPQRWRAVNVYQLQFGRAQD